jgi:hypothetical protein
MFTAKDIVIKSISSESANKIVKIYHYSRKVTQNSQLHFGVFLNGTIQGALQFGPSIDKRRMAQSLNIGFNEFLELNRMALSDLCPKNSESRALSICLSMIRKRYPHIKVIVSFADACQCGDGTIYKASGFKLLSYKENISLLKLTESAKKELSKIMKIDSDVIAKKSLDDHVVNGKYASSIAISLGSKPLIK